MEVEQQQPMINDFTVLFVAWHQSTRPHCMLERVDSQHLPFFIFLTAQPNDTQS